MQFLWLILLLRTDSGYVLFVTFSMFHLWAHSVPQMPSFFSKFLQTHQRGIRQSNLLRGSLMSHAPLKTVGVDFTHSVSSAKLNSCQDHVREDVPLAPMTWRCKNWLRYSWAPDWVVQGQFCSTNVLADDSEVWPWLWHVTCTLETIFLL